MMLDFLEQTIFREKYDTDNRVPRSDLYIDVPKIGRFGMIDFDPMFWGQLTVLILLQTITNLVCAVLIYRVILQRPGTTTAFLTGYGLICPVLMAIPYYCIQALDLKNCSMMIASAASPSLLFWRNFEAMYGTTPAFATESLSSFIMYYCSTVQFDFDPKTKKVRPATTARLLQKGASFAWLFTQTAIMFSILIPCKYQVFPIELTWANLLSWRNLVNNYLLAYLTSLSLECGSTGIGLGISVLTGIDTMDLNVSPLTTSTSPSDFWGNRWNRLVSSALKRGVFVPVRKQGFSRPLAALLTFLASGLLHEYVVLLLRSHHPNAQDMTILGKQSLFFVWNGVVLCIEHLLRGNKSIALLSKNLPRQLRTFLVIMTVLPLSHLFYDAYLELGFYNSFSMGFPRVVMTKTT